MIMEVHGLVLAIDQFANFPVKRTAKYVPLVDVVNSYGGFFSKELVSILRVFKYCFTIDF